MSYGDYSRRDRKGSYGGGRGNGGGLGANLRPPDWTKIQLVAFQKDFYQENPIVSSRSPEEIQAFRLKHEMVVSGDVIPKPVTTFQEAMFPDYLLNEIAKAGFKLPTPIQCQGWPLALSGRDCIGVARTGSGKTLAFILPAIVHINAQPLLSPGDGPIVLTLSPTRELATQTLGECHKFGESSRIKYTCVVGGVPKRNQSKDLRDGVEIVIATPGRLIDFLENAVTNLKRVTYLVFDEADRMLDMGFEPQIRSICSMIRPDRQTLLWSATWPNEVKDLASDFTHSPLQVTIGTPGALNICKDIKQVIRIVQDHEKKKTLYDFIESLKDGSKVLIFCETKRGCDALCDSLRRDGWPARAMHGDKKQEERDWVLQEFRSGKSPMLIATDVASRGLDVKNIGYVINFDFPNSLEEYVHRCGRTARAGAKGTAITFFTSKNGKKAAKLIKLLQNSTCESIPPELFRFAEAARGQHRGPGRYRGSKGNSGVRKHYN